MKQTKIILLSLILLFTAACSEGKYGSMSDAELAKKQQHCDSVPKKSAVFASGCENVRKEIERRKKK